MGEKLDIAEDGGFSEVPRMFSKIRYAFALLHVGFFVMNCYILVFVNINEIAGKSLMEEKAADDSLPLLLNRICSLGSDRELRPQVILGVHELLLFTGFTLTCVICIVRILFNDRVHRWHSVATLFFEVVPEMCSMSAMRLLYFVAPAVFIPSLTAHIECVLKDTEENRSANVLKLLRFALL